jgi:N-acetyl-anhydromuramyl-L-alanine amidase AmpD
MREIIRRLRAAGVEVLELPGWETRGADWARVPRGIVDHHDASTRKAGEWGALGIIRDGRPDVPGPLAQFQIGRCLDGVARVAVVAAGRANHAGKGGPLLGAPRDSGNSWLYGAEAANDGVSEPYTDAAHRAHDILFRAVIDVCRVGASNVVGHREWAPGRKSDPRYDMGWRRSRVAAVSTGGGSAPVPSTTPPGGRPLLREPFTGEPVRAVQAFMRRVFPTYAGALVVDGVFGPSMRAVVVEFQRRSKLTPDGVIGPKTWAALESHGYR